MRGLLGSEEHATVERQQRIHDRFAHGRAVVAGSLACESLERGGESCIRPQLVHILAFASQHLTQHGLVARRPEDMDGQTLDAGKRKALAGLAVGHAG